MLPTAGFKDHVTPVLDVPATTAVKACTPDGPSITLPGDRATLTGGASVMLALVDFDGSAVLVAVTTSICGDVTEAGAVYTPAIEMLPTAGLMDQVTPVFNVPETSAVNVCVPDGPRTTLPGDKATLTDGVRVRLALADFDGSAALVAVTVTVCCEVTETGAV